MNGGVGPASAGRRIALKMDGLLVDRAAHFVAAQGRDDPLDLAPVAEAEDIAGIAAALGPRRSLESGIVAEPFHQLGGIGQRMTTVDE
jgi:hypothetical protein